MELLLTENNREGEDCGRGVLGDEDQKDSVLDMSTLSCSGERSVCHS